MYNIDVKANALKELELFNSKFRKRLYKKGQILIEEDESPDTLFCLLRGYVRKFYLFESGNELTLQILSPMTYFPLVSLTQDAKNNCCFESITECILLKITKEEFKVFLLDKPALKFELMGRVIRNYSKELDRMEVLMYAGAYGKVTSVILYLAKQFGIKSRKIIVVPIKFTHQDIAGLAGITRETASLVMKKLKDKKIIYYCNSIITVPSVTRLKKELTVSILSNSL